MPVAASKAGNKTCSSVWKWASISAMNFALETAPFAQSPASACASALANKSSQCL